MRAQILRLGIMAAVVASLTIPAQAQQPIVYPAKGQTPDQQAKDDSECYAWAKQTTGIDPSTVAASPSAPPPSSWGGGQRVGGAARGAAGGAAIGAIAGDAGQGAAIGAIAGTMAGGRRARRNSAAMAEQAQTEKSQALNGYYRAFAACMQGRGYTIQ